MDFLNLNSSVHSTEQTDKTFHLKNALKTWREARSICREQHTDLVSGLTQLRDGDFRKEIEGHQHQQVWIGLFRHRWRWSDGSAFRLWDPEQFEDGGDEACAAVSDGNWKFDKCNERKYFFCSIGEYMSSVCSVLLLLLLSTLFVSRTLPSLQDQITPKSPVREGSSGDT